MTNEVRILTPEDMREIAEAHGVHNGPITAHFTDNSYGIAGTADNVAVALSHVCELASQIPSFILTVGAVSQELKDVMESVQVMASYPDFANIIEDIASIGGDDSQHAARLLSIIKTVQ